MRENLIETSRLILRAPDARDVDSLVQFYSSERALMAGGNVPHPDAVTRSYAMLGHWVHRGYGMFAIVPKGSESAVGLAGPHFPPGRPETEVGWILFDGAEGRGFATEAARASIDFARKSLDWPEIVHYIDPDNAKSIAVAVRLGARLDQTAPQPRLSKPCLVYRQVKPNKLADNDG